MNERVFDVTEGLQPLATRKGCTDVAVRARVVMQQPGVTSPIIGPRTMEQLEDNLAALDVTITDEDRAQVDDMIPPGRMAAPFYEASFGPSQFRQG